MVNSENDKLSYILEAARKRFAHFGLAKTTMTEIASDISMSKASLYYYFPDKEHLFTAVIGREMDSFIEKMNTVVDAPGDAADKLKMYNSEKLLSFQQLINLGKFSSATYDSLKPAFSSLAEEFLKRENKLIERVIGLGVKRKEFEVKNIPLTAEMFVNVTRGLRMLMIKQKESYFLSEDDYVLLQKHQEHFTDIFLKGILKNKQII
jgi:AcrR family transcriptional regulator